ncbi:MAG: hypothetical protein JW902_04940, partial [Syntrophaceae bacterium]|nr:hypothetical protein [Syntrophaceae bacterium]
MMHLSVKPFLKTESSPERGAGIRPNIGRFGDGFIRNISSRIFLPEEHAQSLRYLGSQGTVLYALKNKSRLNA